MPVVTHPINSALTVATAGKVAPVEQVQKPGAVVDAQVLSTRVNLVKIAISGMLLEVLSEVQLQPGTALKLAVSQNADGLRLAVVGQQLPDQAARTTNAAGISQQLAAATTARVIAPPLQPDQVRVRGSAEPSAALQAAAVSQAARAAAPVQASLSPLFANLPVIVVSPAVPLNVKAAATQLLLARPNLSENLDAAELRNAFKSSGVLLEASMAKGGAPLAGMPDLKAALTVFRQLVAGWATGEGRSQAINAAQATVTSSEEPASVPPTSTTVISTKPNDASLKPQALQNGAIAADSTDPLALARTAKESQGAILTNVAGKSLSTGEELLEKTATLGAAPGATVAAAQLPARAATEPAPPFRGSSPSVQPIALPSVDPDLPAPQLAARLLDQTDGALARQTLLQVASLPERFEAGSVNQPQQRWAFEIPFATPQGTAVAQFEIAGDESNGTAEAGAQKRVWRARFTLDIETTGPVHALVSLAGGTTTVRMWAERADTAAQLRDNAQALDSALRLADLEPGDIVVQTGQPPQAKPARAGHFLDRAT